MNPTLYLIFGNANSGKSSLVRSLTGLRTSDNINLSFIGQNQTIFFVRMPSLQEGDFIIPDKLDSYMNSQGIGIKNFIFPIRIIGTKVCPFNAEDYLIKIRDWGFQVKGVVLLNPTIPDFYMSYNLDLTDTWIKNPLQLPRNYIAMKVRTKWGLE